MTYENMVPGIFRDRPNRFIAHVEIGGTVETVHVKNTGRCRELLAPGTKVWCQHFAGTPRKTQYDLICVEKENYLINMDSQAPNKAVQEWLLSGGLGKIADLRPETTHGDSRFDFAFRKGDKQCYLEVKGVTLENGGICAFPDAPTERGTKHLRGLQEQWPRAARAMPCLLSRCGLFCTCTPTMPQTPPSARPCGRPRPRGFMSWLWTAR